MDDIHFSQGSEKPTKDPSKLRLYGMKFCPFSERVRMVLLVKKIPHETVNINLKNKPDWFLEISPEGKVPVLDTGDKILFDSLGIVDYLEETYPETSLGRSGSDKELLENFNKVLGPFFGAIYNRENKPLNYYLDTMYLEMDVFENKLKERGTQFFGGDSPGYVDYMIWPWSERSKVPSIIYNEPFTFPKERFPKLLVWRQAMKEQPVIKEVLITAERHAALVQQNIQNERNGTPVDYESI